MIKAMLFALFVALLMVGCGNEKGIVDATKLLDRNGIKYLPNEDMPFTGQAVSFYENWQKKSEVTYKEGKQEGLYTFWLNNGKKYQQQHYEDGQKIGIFREWYPSGQKKWEGIYKEDKPNGLWTLWYENGNKWREGNRKGYENIGLWIYFNDDGTEKSRRTYKNGKAVPTHFEIQN